jgi:indolepyruvate ferredoxin oxidoreductase alpha subunit
MAALSTACGAGYVRTVDPFDQQALTAVLQEAQKFAGPAVIISKYPCVLLPEVERNRPFGVNEVSCVGCKVCLSIGCPALAMRGNKAAIDIALCMGCALCAGLCTKKAINRGDNI